MSFFRGTFIMMFRLFFIGNNIVKTIGGIFYAVGEK